MMVWKDHASDVPNWDIVQVKTRRYSTLMICALLEIKIILKRRSVVASEELTITDYNL